MEIFYIPDLFISYLLNHNRKDSKYTRYHTCFPCDGLGKVTAAKILPVSRTGFISSQTYLELVILCDLNFQSVFRVLFSLVESFALTFIVLDSLWTTSFRPFVDIF